MIKVKYKKIDKELPDLITHSAGAAGFDLYARIDATVPPKSIASVPLNIAIEIPKNHFAMLVARSSLFKLGLMPINGIGIVDSDFRGDTDEVVFTVYNFTDTEVFIERGMRIAQYIFVKHAKFELSEVDTLDNVNRGGLGTTGLK